MKKLIIVALALVAGASLSTIQAGKKDKKAPKSTLQLVSGSDSLSYTAGYVLADIVRDRFLAGLGKEVNDSEDSLQLFLAYQGLFDALRGDTTLFKTPQAEKFLKLEDESLSNLMRGVRERLVPYEGGDRILTDDRAPVELLGMRAIDEIVQQELAYYKERFRKYGFEGLLG